MNGTKTTLCGVHFTLFQKRLTSLNSQKHLLEVLRNPALTGCHTDTPKQFGINNLILILIILKISHCNKYISMLGLSDTDFNTVIKLKGIK